jgi:hypothetical protein
LKLALVELLALQVGLLSLKTLQKHLISSSLGAVLVGQGRTPMEAMALLEVGVVGEIPPNHTVMGAAQLPEVIQAALAVTVIEVLVAAVLVVLELRVTARLLRTVVRAAMERPVYF